MAEPNLSAPLQTPYLMSNTSPPHSQGSGASTPPIFQPTFASYASYSYDSASYHHYHAAQYGPPMSDPNHNYPPSYHHYYPGHNYPTFASHANPRPNSYYPHMLHHTSASNLAANPASTPPLHLSSPPTDPQNNVEVLPIIDPAMSSGPQSLQLPPYVSVPTIHEYGPYSGRRPGQGAQLPAAPQPGRFGSEAAPNLGQSRGPSRVVNVGSPDSPRHLTSPHRRQSYERPHQPGLQSIISPDRRSPLYLSPHSRRSDRSVSPRTSNRRSFERYATDLSGPGAPFDPSEDSTVRARVAQRRRIRERAWARQAHVPDPNIPTPAQMQVLKDKLRHFLPSELPEGSSSCCDICQKDYSVKHCDPTEDEEVAIQLPCMHVFGEHCINTWFETCKTHKNKITCPMCRKLLVESVRQQPPHLIGSMPEMMALFSRSLDRGAGQGLSAAEREVLEHLSRSGLEADIPHV